MNFEKKIGQKFFMLAHSVGSLILLKILFDFLPSNMDQNNVKCQLKTINC
jgi:alpha-beta hydrolase superfamily lysophospholipase